MFQVEHRLAKTGSRQKADRRKMQMFKARLLTGWAVISIGTVMATGQATRTWVSGVGDDANPCSRTAPCKTFAGAISKTAPGGEIDALDPGGFGALTITKSITLDGGGGQVASVLVAGTNGIVVSAGASDVVIIRNIRLDGLLGNGSNSANAGINGIRWISGKALHIEHCWIFGFNANGIDIEKSDGGEAFIIDTTVENNGLNNNGTGGVFTSNTTNNVSIAIDHLRTINNLNGVLVRDFSKVSVRDSNASGNQVDGFLVQANTNAAVMDVSFSATSHNGVSGIQAGGSGGQSTVSITNVSSNDNGSSGFIAGMNGTINSFGNNYITTNSNGGTLSHTFSPQ
jgi:hypothetical protein